MCPPEPAANSSLAEISWEQLKQKTETLGFAEIGWLKVASSGTHEFYQAWLKQGYAAGMQYLHRHSYLKKNLLHFAPWARSILVLAHPYGHHMSTDKKNGCGQVSRYAHQKDYHQILGNKLEQLAVWLQRQSNSSLLPATPLRYVACVDSKPLLEREWAVRAGLGWIGKNTMLINHRHGSWWFLAELLLNCPVPDHLKNQPSKKQLPRVKKLTRSANPNYPVAKFMQELPIANSCGSCRACLDACPTQALSDSGTLDATRCISYLTIEHKGPLPIHLRSAMDSWIFGCDICQQVCPWNNTFTTTTEPDFLPLASQDQPNLLELLAEDESQWQQRFSQTPLARPKRRGLLRNAAIALGNQLQKNEFHAPLQALRTLCRLLLSESEPLIRGAAVWALGQSQSKLAARWLKRMANLETHPQVLHEIMRARSVIPHKIT